VGWGDGTYDISFFRENLFSILPAGALNTQGDINWGYRKKANVPTPQTPLPAPRKNSPPWLERKAVKVPETCLAKPATQKSLAHLGPDMKASTVPDYCSQTTSGLRGPLTPRNSLRGGKNKGRNKKINQFTRKKEKEATGRSPLRIPIY